MVKQSRQGQGQVLPPRPAGVPGDARHEAANALHSAAVRLLRTVRSVDSGLDLDGPRASLLSVLFFAGPLPVTHLAAIEQVSPPAITKMVTALEAAGLAERRPSAHDRRVVLVAATPEGRRAFERGRAARVRAVAKLLHGLSDRDIATLHRAATLIASRL